MNVILKGLAGAVLMLGLISPSRAALVDRLVLEGEITRSDHQTYLELPFDVPAGVERLDVAFTHDGRDQRTTIDLGLIDPGGMRGWSGGNKSSLTISAVDSTPSYFTGPIQPGTWKLLLGVPNIREGVTAHYEATIALYSDPDEGSPLSQPAGGGDRAWYRGDLHSHSAHSDGSCSSLSGKRIPCPAFRMLRAAQDRGLDFLSLSDHNARSQTNSLRELAPYFDTISLIPGREITTFHGHFNVFGTVEPIDFRLSGEPGAVNRIFDAAIAAGGTISLNHPGLPAGEDCMGCGWVAKGTDFGKVHAVEVINGGTLMKTSGTVKHPYSGIPFWENLLNQGYRLTAIADSDVHDPETPLNEAGSIGRPMTVIEAESRSAADLLAALRAGHIFIDVLGTPASLAALTASVADETYRMGDVIHLAPGQKAIFDLAVVTETGRSVEIIEDGKVAKRISLPRNSSERHDIQFEVSSGDTHWVRANVIDDAGNIVLLTNPLYLEWKP